MVLLVIANLSHCVCVRVCVCVCVCVCEKEREREYQGVWASKVTYIATELKLKPSVHNPKQICVTEIGLKEIGSETVDWIHLAWKRGPVADACQHGNEI